MSLTPSEKAVLVLVYLDEDIAAEVVSHFDENDLRRLATAASKLDKLSMDQLDAACEDFDKQMREPVLPAGPSQYLRRLASASHDSERVERAFAEQTVPPLDLLRAARTSTLTGLLNDEHPQVAAVVLSQLGQKQASAVLKTLSDERRADLIGRIANLDEVPVEAVQLASESLAKALAASGGLGGETRRKEFDGVGFAANLLNEFPLEESEAMLAAIEQSGSDVAPKLREAMFTFDDLEKIPARTLQPLLREVSSERLLVALKSAPESLRDHFFSAMSSRASAAMREDLAAMPPMRLSEVESAQREIVEAALRLAAEGKMPLPTQSSEQLV
jgi:flagellar motor switch protein FliG